ncbi:cyclic nucleotide-binding domain-containing protein [uncultured Kiloniella sp.]|uniref:Crp/Fnr family transcriptional regulator n=1 Tax=Kiloniella sp. TaxID=1938587 RepID=UPI00261F9D0F|nr:cyclic nucleotide-binding domain-containing protein [uncultured Kiloniella sp.]
MPCAQTMSGAKIYPEKEINRHAATNVYIQGEPFSFSFSRIGRRKKKVLLPLSRIETFPAGATIVKFGEKAENFYVLEDGYVRLVLNSTCGDKKSTIDVLGPGSAFGEESITRSALNNFTCIALDEVETRVIPGDVLRRILLEDPVLLFRMMGSISLNMHSLMTQIADLKMRSTAERLSMFLLGLSGKEDGDDIVTLPYDKRVIADKLGMSPETLSRTFAKLKKIGVNTQPGNQVVITDIEMLADYCGYSFV